MNYESVCHWEIGGRVKNQDSISLQQLRIGKKPVLFAVVCDGIGGLQQGEYASGYVAKQLTEWFYSSGIRSKIGKKLNAESSRVLYRIHKGLIEYGEANNIKLGTTMTAVLIRKNRYMVFHTGDSRAYLWKKKLGGYRMRCITNDHTYKRGVLNRCVGNGAYWKPDIATGVFRKNEAMVICSDGFYEWISNQQMECYLSPWKTRTQSDHELEICLRKRLSEVAKRGKERGSKDNISAIYLQRIE